MILLSDPSAAIERALRHADYRPLRHAAGRLVERYALSPAAAERAYYRHVRAIHGGGASLLPGMGVDGSNVYVLSGGERPDRRVFYPATKMCRLSRRGPSIALVVTYLNSSMVFENYAR